MASYDEPPGGWIPEDEVRCCVCGRFTNGHYDDREDSPTCGRFQCGLRIQAARDYHDERG